VCQGAAGARARLCAKALLVQRPAVGYCGQPGARLRFQAVLRRGVGAITFCRGALRRGMRLAGWLLLGP